MPNNTKYRNSRLIQTIVRQVLAEELKKINKLEDIPFWNKERSWKEHDNGIARYNRYGHEIGDTVFDVPYYGDSAASAKRRKESHQAADFGHSSLDTDIYGSAGYDRLINDPVLSSHHFSHDDNNAVFYRPADTLVDIDDLWKPIEKETVRMNESQLIKLVVESVKRLIDK